MTARHALDATLEVLMTQRRRQLLLALKDHEPGETVDVSTLVSAIGGGKETRVEAHHVHLPLLDDRGFIQWDRDANEVSRGPRFEELEAYLDVNLERNQQVGP
ncbi:DUF7344 domain-containing protein [Natrialbaceae archaeon A-gly3]